MRRILVVVILGLVAVCQSQPALQRPPITGISHVAFYSSNLDCRKVILRRPVGTGERSVRPNVYHVGVQAVELEPLPPNHGHDLISHVAFATPDAEGLRKYLAAHGVKVPEKINTGGNGTLWFAMKDPEGNPIEFVQERPELTARHVLRCRFRRS